MKYQKATCWIIFLLFSCTINAINAQIGWEVRNLKHDAENNSIEFLLIASMPDKLHLLAMTNRNQNIFAGSTVSFHIPYPDGIIDLATTVLPRGGETKVLKNYDVYTNKATFECSISFSGLNTTPKIGVILAHNRINANKRIDIASTNICFENIGLTQPKYRTESDSTFTCNKVFKYQ